MLIFRQKQTGFTIVELLIIIVVIAILATISIMAYNGIQVRTRDSMRTDTIAKIKNALELYKIGHGQYPSATANPGCCGGWEASDDVDGSFLESLKDYGFPDATPVDPVNNASYRFFYYRYPPGGGSPTYGCDTLKGGFYVLRVRYEDVGNKPKGNSLEGDCTSPQPAWVDVDGNALYNFHSLER